MIVCVYIYIYIYIQCLLDRVYNELEIKYGSQKKQFGYQQ